MLNCVYILSQMVLIRNKLEKEFFLQFSKFCKCDFDIIRQKFLIILITK